MFWLRVRGALSFSPFKRCPRPWCWKETSDRHRDTYVTRTCLKAQPGSLPVEAVEPGVFKPTLEMGLRRRARVMMHLG